MLTPFSLELSLAAFSIADQPPLMFQLVIMPSRVSELNVLYSSNQYIAGVLNSSIRRSKSRLFNVLASSHREHHEPTQYLPENDHK